jgi:phospholipid/cholesterol/gamma-HCH transport system substrate-binding protein
LKTQSAWWRRRIAAVAGAAGALVLVLVVVLSTSAGGSSGGYSVRAIFDNAGNVIAGEDVKIDGVKVGSVSSVTPTPEGKAAVVIGISNPGFQDFRTDASCTVRPQALIGEKFVDCLPTQPRVEPTPPPPRLKRIPSGREGAGEWLLPVAKTHSPVDPDLLGDIARLPERQRLTIILNELGAGFAGRGQDLSVIIRRANPALQEFEAVLSILASENRVLTHLAVESDRSLAPLAADRGRLADFIKQNNTLAQATARHRGALAQNLADFPPFLRQLGPAMERLGRFADQTTPTFRDLGVAAPGLNRIFQSLGPFSKSSEAFFESLGKSTRVAGPALEQVQPLLTRTKSLGAAGKPFAGNLSETLTSFRSTGGLERLLDFIYLGGGVENGYDSLGHFLRAEVVASPSCVSYLVTAASCTGKFVRSSTASAASTGGTTLVMARTLAVLNGMTPAQAIAKYPGPLPGETGGAAGATGAFPANGTATTTQPVGGAAAGTTYYTPTEEGSEASGMLLNYLLGN